MSNLRGKRIHFMGAGGIGVSALALLAHRSGASVSACDRCANEMTEYLESEGVPVTVGHDTGHCQDIDRLVYTSAVPKDHPERAAAEARGVAVRRGSFLGELLAGKRVLGVCGTHGKTTTTWLLSQLLNRSGLNPTLLLGGVPAGERSNLILGNSDLVVTELDESDGSFLETTVEVGVVTNVEPDHLDYYGSEEAVYESFRHFAQAISPTGGLVYSVPRSPLAGVEMAVDPMAVGQGGALSGEILGHEETAVRVRLRHSAEGDFEACFALPGEHNLQNLLCALGAAMTLGLKLSDLVPIVPSLTGVARRFEHVGTRRGVVVVDDYAHHPTEVAAALA
ncbi:MAG: Mur ligase domain-containing protein, partial [Planctomycetota bacterium]